ncbi:hypothetical protein [Microbacterium sp. SLBN-111]|uniref:hypothetical protein n=1 Tax=Microbacterium sp. SLBN-111 TaxID=3377733 RepID=UPI003C730276
MVLHSRRAAVTAAAFAMALLSACSPGAGNGKGDVSTPEGEVVTAPETESACPPDLIASFESNDEIVAPVDTSLIGGVFSAELPEAACVLLSDNSGDSDMDYVYMFWPGEDQNFANKVGNVLVSSGSSALGDPITYQKDAADLTLYAYPANDPLHWGDYFDGFPQIVVGTGHVPKTGLVG